MLSRSKSGLIKRTPLLSSPHCNERSAAQVSDRAASPRGEDWELGGLWLRGFFCLRAESAGVRAWSAQWLGSSLRNKGANKMKSQMLAAVLLVTFLLVSCAPRSTPFPDAVQQPMSVSQHIIVGLDPGHGWGDSKTGATGNGLVEKDLNLEIALLTKQILENSSIEVVMTREGDSYDKSLTEAAVTMNKAGVDLVVSIHTNSGGVNASCTEACVTEGKNTDTQSQEIAQLLTESISTTLSIPNLGISPEVGNSGCGRHGRLYIHDMNAPSTIIETGFLSNPTQAELLKSRKKDFAQAIAQAIMNYFGVQKPAILSAAPVQPELGSTVTSATVEVPSNNSSTTGLHFSEQGPTTWPIQKDPGMVIAHVKTNGCWDFGLSGAGQGYETYNHYENGEKINEYQSLFSNLLYRNPNFQPTKDWDGSAIIDFPYTDGNEHFISNPNLEMLQISEVTPDCYWEVDIMPLDSAKKIYPGQVLSGTYDDVLAVVGNIKSIEFLSSDYVTLNAFSTWGAWTNNGTHVCLGCLDEDEDYLIENLPSGITYIQIESQSNWELLVK